MLLFPVLSRDLSKQSSACCPGEDRCNTLVGEGGCLPLLVALGIRGHPSRGCGPWPAVLEQLSPGAPCPPGWEAAVMLPACWGRGWGDVSPPQCSPELRYRRKEAACLSASSSTSGRGYYVSTPFLAKRQLSVLFKLPSPPPVTSN